MTQTLLLKLVAAAAITGALALAWWGWQSADASMLLLGMRLC
ncbi:hypothetical protein [Halomonas chromatireducens]|uniref:Uncharacterized protein n=1 Tax=Halomonas chromatireducens TaxID=507626 RepID=A0A0X8HED3_9GAMM|nr:hypothetical protein [Halomonas chromatireducens]AMD01049.1 hypothetical protein LOKO_01982 [Halomonas chromatireducens]